MKFSNILNVFSRRNKPPTPFAHQVSISLRNKILLFCNDVFNNERFGWGGGSYTSEFWEEIHQVLLYRHGRLQLTTDRSPQTRADDAIVFLLNCDGEEFLDFIEYIFRVRVLFRIQVDENVLVAEINELFTSENFGFELTEMVKEEVVEAIEGAPFFGSEHKVIKVVAYPQIIKKESQVEQVLMIGPVLQLLAEPKYKSANQEYLEALEDYRKGDYGDCLTKCGSAFESVMKIICHSKHWPYKQTDTASTLLSTIIKNGDVETFFEQPIIIIATLRNRLSKAHGAGTTPKKASANTARYALNATAAAIVFLVNETK